MPPSPAPQQAPQVWVPTSSPAAAVKNAVLTGGSSGLGLQLAHSLGSRGFRVIVLARGRARLDQAVVAMREAGVDAHGMQCDVTDDVQLLNVRDRIVAEFGPIHFLALNAGRVTPQLLSTYTNTRDLRADLETNLVGTLLSAYAFLPHLVKGARVLLVSSGFGLMGAAGYSVYAASKAGVINFGEALRRELLCRNISVHVACPGDIDTPLLHEEYKAMPGWMKRPAPRGVMQPALAATRILRQCEKGRFFIVISADVRALVWLSKVLPRRLRDFILDRMFPLPT